MPSMTARGSAPRIRENGDMNERADAIVVLGGRLMPDGRCGPASARRVRRGIELHAAGAAPLLVLSGGGGRPCAEAVAMKAVALEAGVAETAIRIEPHSMNTFENAREVARMLGPDGLHRIILVTDAYHMPRARFLFRAAGLTVAAAVPAHRHRPGPALVFLCREAAAWLRNLPRALRLRAGT
jgi:uncharacterized SAM-binding protein YcdF (DUF218 family)